MATYAAMVDCVDQGVGRVMQTLEELAMQEAYHERPDVRPGGGRWAVAAYAADGFGGLLCGALSS